MEHHLRNKYKETPEITPNDQTPQDIINEIFENVPVSLGKQHFSPKPGFRVLRKHCNCIRFDKVSLVRFQ